MKNIFISSDGNFSPSKTSLRSAFGFLRILAPFLTALYLATEGVILVLLILNFPVSSIRSATELLEAGFCSSIAVFGIFIWILEVSRRVQILKKWNGPLEMFADTQVLPRVLSIVLFFKRMGNLCNASRTDPFVRLVFILWLIPVTLRLVSPMSETAASATPGMASHSFSHVQEQLIEGMLNAMGTDERVLLMNSPLDLRLVERAARNGFYPAIALRADLAIQPNFMHRHPGKSYLAVKELADLGAQAGEINLAVFQSAGLGTTQNLGAAFERYLKLIPQDSPAVSFNLGNLFYEGRFGRPNYFAARRWFQRSATKGDLEAQFLLAYLYEKGLGGPKNTQAATTLFTSLAEKDYRDSLHRVLAIQIQNMRLVSGVLEQLDHSDELTQVLQSVRTLERTYKDGQINDAVKIYNGLLERLRPLVQQIFRDIEQSPSHRMIPIAIG